MSKKLSLFVNSLDENLIESMPFASKRFLFLEKMLTSQLLCAIMSMLVTSQPCKAL